MPLAIPDILAADVICYLSHPLGCENGNETVQRQDNIFNSGLWLRFLMENTGWAVNCPWFSYVATLPNYLRPMAFVAQLQILKTCNIAAFCGFWSPHMQYERTACERNNIPILDLTDLGITPPIMDKVAAKAMIGERLIKLQKPIPG